MEGQEIMALEIGHQRMAKFHRDADRAHLASSFITKQQRGPRLLRSLPIALGMLATLAWLMAR